MRERLELDFFYSSLWTQAASQMRVSLLKIEPSVAIFQVLSAKIVADST